MIPLSTGLLDLVAPLAKKLKVISWFKVLPDELLDEIMTWSAFTGRAGHYALVLSTCCSRLRNSVYRVAVTRMKLQRIEIEQHPIRPLKKCPLSVACYWTLKCARWDMDLLIPLKEALSGSFNPLSGDWFSSRGHQLHINNHYATAYYWWHRVGLFDRDIQWRTFVFHVTKRYGSGFTWFLSFLSLFVREDRWPESFLTSSVVACLFSAKSHCSDRDQELIMLAIGNDPFFFFYKTLPEVYGIDFRVPMDHPSQKWCSEKLIGLLGKPL